MLRIEKVNIYVVPNNSERRLVVDRGIVTVTQGGVQNPPAIETFDRDTGKLLMRIVATCIADKTKNVIVQANNLSFRKGQTVVHTRTPVMVGTQASTKITFCMDLRDHRTFNSALDLF